MDSQSYKDTAFIIKRLSANNDYYNNVFKKTERTVSTTFYVLSFIQRNEKTKVHIEDITTRAFAAYEAALKTLECYEHDAEAALFSLQRSLLALEGALRHAVSARLLSDAMLAVILEPLDALMRTVRNHYLKETPLPAPAAAAPRAARRARRAVTPRGDISSEARLIYGSLTDRATRITTILEAKPQATIKDITEIMTDVSEKTIQRELNRLIEKGQVVREGERRWSKYSVVK
jgi:DNA-binding transcriptional ArsR family regulator